MVETKYITVKRRPSFFSTAFIMFSSSTSKFMDPNACLSPIDNGDMEPSARRRKQKKVNLNFSREINVSGAAF